MSESRNNSTRILFDLQACQASGSARRGVGRYSSALAETAAAIGNPREIYGLTSRQLPYEYEPLNINPTHVLELSSLPEWHTVPNYQGGGWNSLDGILITAQAQNLKPDLIHVSHVFEGYNERIGIFDPHQKVAGQVVSATLYDLIPLVFQNHYFQDPQFRHWYYSRLAWLRKADLLLSISESSRQDAIRLLGIEPWRIVTIYGGVSDHFRPPVDRKFARNRLLERFSLREKIVLYTGGDDFRKNIKGAIRGFSKVPPKLRADAQLVIICSILPERKKMYLDEAHRHGLTDDEVLFTGSVPEDDLVDFYGICDVFVFPSLYEGLGLPVLEAMACGAPVIGSNNSSISELILREDALFDACRDESIAERITQILSDKHFASDLRKHGPSRAAEFNWQRSATLALDAFDEAISQARHAGVQCAVTGWAPRKRLAVFSPLPPCRSGIADYNAQFLPFLARHFDIDLYVDGYSVSDESLTSAYRIFDAKDFEHVAPAYDLILYEFGNSEFHAHMLPLLEKFPGVVGLHDAYLSGLIGYVDFNKGNRGFYEQEMIAAHGPVARQYLAPIQAHPDPVGGSIVDLPCTRRVLERATGVISHSPFNLQIARQHYPKSWYAPYRTIPQMVVVPAEITAEEKFALRAELGFKPDDFILASYGHIAWTKWGDKLLEAFLVSNLRDNKKAHLVFAGQLSEDHYGRHLIEAIQESGLEDRIRITGFLSGEDYTKYLQVADLAVQLRTKSRGGTPKGVLDCLAHGVPVMVNNDASYTDYPEDIVIKLEPEPSIESIARKIEQFSSAPSLLSEFSDRGRQYVIRNHDPAQCAASYAAAMHEFSAKASACKNETWVNALAPFIADTTDLVANAKQAADWLSKRKTPSRQCRLYIDVSHVVQSDHETGIQRVVKEIVKALYIGDLKEIVPVAVELKSGNLLEARDWLGTKGIITAGEKQQTPSPIEFARGDIFLMLDSSWARYGEFHHVFEKARHAAVPIITAIYDILPITLPKENFVEGGPEWFEEWFRDAVQSSDGLICISKVVAHEVQNYIQERCPEKKRIKVGYWHLGSDFSSADLDHGHSSRINAVRKKPYLLVAGTIEPRKSHPLILDAMEQVWANGSDLCLCIAGKEGWLVKDVMARIKSHPELGKRLFLIENPTDDEISSLYGKASGLLFLSIGEGFGLPLVEAAHYGTPIICSDIPVFREIAQEFATYLKRGNAQEIGKGILHWREMKENGLLPDTRNMPRLTWKESADQMVWTIMNENWLWKRQ